MNIFAKRSDLPFSRKSDHKKDKGVVSFTHELSRILFEYEEMIVAMNAIYAIA